MSRIIGIDLGTTNSLVSYWENGTPKLIPNALGDYLTPSVVSIDAKGIVYVGKIAKERLVTNPENTVSVFKRSMGTDRKYNLNGNEYLPEELSAIVLKVLKEDAEKYFGEPIEEAIISVPAYFSDIARKATRKAGQLAGLKVDRIVNEPSAAALACQHIKKQTDAKMLVFDFGGGTLDVSLVECVDNVIEILAVSGNNYLGGSDFDRVIAEYFCKECGFTYGGLSRNHQEIVLKCAEKVKRKLSLEEEATMYVTLEENTWNCSISRKQLIKISSEIFKKIAAPIRRVLTDGNVSPLELSQVVMVGGSCQMPIVQQYLRFLLKNVEIVMSDPDHIIALGIGVYAGIKERNADIKDMILTDICPFSLGISVYNENDPKKNYMDILIPRNSALPARHENLYFTVSDGQKLIAVRVYQGEDMYAENNLKLGELTVKVPAAPKGKEFVKVSFSYDINGLLVIDIDVPSTGEKKQMVFLNGISVEADEETKKQMKELEKLTIAPKDEETNKLLLARAESLYAQLNGEAKKTLELMTKQFVGILQKGSKTKAIKAAKGLMRYMDMLEQEYLEHLDMQEDLDEFEKWFDELEEAEEDDTVDDWGKLYYTS